MSSFLLRHGPKQYNNTYYRPYGLDSPLDHHHFPDLTPLQRQLQEMEFTQIICSPFLRCRETAALIRELKGENIPIRIDTRLTEYLGHHPPRNMKDIHPSTWDYQPTIITDLEIYREEVLAFPFAAKTLYILHGLAIKIKGIEAGGMNIQTVPELTGIEFDGQSFKRFNPWNVNG